MSRKHLVRKTWKPALGAALLMALLTVGLQSAYTYYLTTPAGTPSYDLSYWWVNAVGSSSYPDTSIYAVSKVAVPDGSSDYEVKTAIPPHATYCQFGIFHTDVLLRASGDLLVHDVWGWPAWQGTGYVARYSSPNNCSAQAQLSIRKIVNGTETVLAMMAVPPQAAGTVLRASVRSDGSFPGVFVRLGNDIDLFQPESSIASGKPGVGQCDYRPGNPQMTSLPSSELGPLDRTAPNAVSSGAVTVLKFVDYVKLSWPAAVDDANGVGVNRYDVYKNGVFQGSTKTPAFDFLGLTPNTAYTFGIVTVDNHLSVSAMTTLPVTTLAIGQSSSVDGRRVGVHKFASNWGALGESIDTRSGNLNYSIPVAAPQLRTAGSIPFALSYNSQNWRRDNGTVTRLGGDIGFGWGWRMQAGSLTPVWQNANTFLYWLFTDSTGAEYRLDVYAGGKWTGKDGLYATYEPATDKLHFNDGSHWLMTVVSAVNEVDAGTRYPQQITDKNGNYIWIEYRAAIGTPVWNVNTSARVSQINYSNKSIQFNYNADVVPHLTSTSGSDPSLATLTYGAPTALTDPFTGAGYGNAVRLATHTRKNTTLTTSFTYNGSAELTKVTMPYGGELQWDYATFTYVNSVQFREVSARRLVKSAGAAAVTYNLTRDSGAASQPMHTRLTLTDTGSGAVKDWYFSSANDYTRGFVTQFDERGTAGGAVLRRAQYVYTRDANLMPYVQSSTGTIDVGLSSQQVAKTDQTLDVYGNPVQSRVYALNSVTTPAKTVNCTFLGPLAGTYIRNLVSSCSVTNGSQTFSLGSANYDGLPLTAVPDAWSHLATHGTAYTTRGNPTHLTRPGGSNVTMAYNELGEVISSTVGSVSTGYVFQSSNDYFAPTVISPGNNANLNTSISYTQWNAPTTQTSANGSWTNTTYDGAGRVTLRTNADGNTVSVAYNDAARQVTETVGARWVRSIADGLGRPVRVETGDGSGTKTMVDSEYEPCACSPIGKLKRQSLPYAPGGSPLWVTYVYDGLGRTTQVQQPLGAGSTTTAYVGNKVTVTDPAGRWKTQTTNAFGELVQMTEPNPAGGTFET